MLVERRLRNIPQTAARALSVVFRGCGVARNHSSDIVWQRA